MGWSDEDERIEQELLKRMEDAFRMGFEIARSGKVRNWSAGWSDYLKSIGRDQPTTAMFDREEAWKAL